MKKLGKKGFTLMELLVVIAIIVIAATIVVPSAIGFYKSAERIRLDQTAKTIFLAAQGSMTQLTENGGLSALEPDGIVDLTSIIPAVAGEEQSENGGKIGYINTRGKLEKMLAPYIRDPEVLANAIYIEYNIETGVVRSAFYSETAAELSFGGGELEDVKSREQSELKTKRQGYYGVDFTGFIVEGAALPTPEPTLVNSDMLTLEFENIMPEGISDIKYRVTIFSSRDNSELLQIEDIPAENALYPLSADFVLDHKDSRTALPTPVGGSAATMSHAIYIKGDKLAIVLDSTSASIFENYKTIKPGMIYAAVQAYSGGISSTEGVSNIEHSYFADEAAGSGRSKEEKARFAALGGKAEDEGEFVYGIANARHLSNMNHVAGRSGFSLKNDVDWLGGENWEGIRNRKNALKFTSVRFATGTEPFTGVFDGAGHKITNLTVVEPENTGVGLFAETKLAVIRDATLESCVFSGKGVVGSFAGISVQSELKNLMTAANGKTPSTVAAAEDMAGGIVGRTMGTEIKGCLNGADVNGRDRIGGVVGEVLREPGAERMIISGLKNSGRVEGRSYVGGITGSSSNIISSCENSGAVRCVAAGGQYIGGIAGENAGEIRTCVNISSALGAADYEGIVFGALEAPAQYFGSFVGGIAGGNTGAISGCRVKNAVTGATAVGGIAGQNGATGTISALGAGNDCEGAVIASGDFAGGIVGENLSSAELSGFTSAAHVAAESFAGGIVGSNGAAGTQSGASISKSFNRGLVFAKTSYGGGIAGSNTGVIDCCGSLLAGRETLAAEAERRSGEGGSYVGGIAGYNNGKISGTEKAPVDGSGFVKGRNFVGGIVGYNDKSGELYHCVTSGGNVIATGDCAGGYIGLNISEQKQESMGELINEANVKGRYFVGGVIGCNVTSDANLEAGTLFIGGDNGSAKTAPKIEGEAYVGGIIGYNSSEMPPEAPKPYERVNEWPPTPEFTTCISESRNFGDISGIRFVGGIIGYNESGSSLLVESCINSGKVTAEQSPKVTDGYYYIGGITGLNTVYGLIAESINDGEVIGPSTYTGGLVELNSGRIEDCINSGRVVGRDGSGALKDNVGGIAGRNNVSVGDSTGLIEDCKIGGGTVIGNDNVGGIAGENLGRLVGCSLVGTTDYDGAEPNVKGRDNVGGIVGRNRGNVLEAASYGGIVEGRSAVGGIIGLGNNSNIYGLDNGARVKGESFVGGIIGKIGDGQNGNIKNCRNMPTAEVISTGTDEDGDVGGITGRTPKYGIIENCANYGSVSGAGMRTGGIVSFNESIVSSCVNAGRVSGGMNTGGIVGLNSAKGSIESCSSKVDLKIDAARCSAEVEGTEFVGGIIGCNEGAMDRLSQEGGKVSGLKNVGGLVGRLLRNDKKSSAAVYADVYGISKKDGSVESPNCIGGVFGCIENSATISGYTFKGTVEFKNSADYQYAGGIIGMSRTGSFVSGCAAGGTVISKGGKNSAAGGIVGLNQNGATVSGCDLRGALEVSSSWNAGGLIGINEGALFLCTNSASLRVIGTEGNCGGFVGQDRAAATFAARADTKIINNATVTGKDNVGGIVGLTGGKISNCENAGTVKNNGDCGGGIVGRHSAGAGEILDCRNRGAVIGAGGNYTGGIVGRISGAPIKGCVNAGKIENIATSFVGGIVGRAENGTLVENCSNSGSVTCGSFKAGTIGGIAGELVGPAKIMGCRAEAAGQIKSEAGAAGGIAGKASGGARIEQCANAGPVMGGANVGGIAGMMEDSGIYACTNEAGARVRGKNSVGGIAGSAKSRALSAAVADSTNSGEVTAQFETSKEDCSDIGGIVGLLEYDYAKNQNANLELSVKNCANLEGLVGTEPANDGGDRFTKNVGGIIGKIAPNELSGNLPPLVEYCANKAPVLVFGGRSGEEDAYVGGIIGFSNNIYAVIQSCDNFARVYSTMNYVGGIMGLNSGYVVSCRNLNTDAGALALGESRIPAGRRAYQICGKNYVGGLVANNEKPSALIYSSVKTGGGLVVGENSMSVAGERAVGGLVARNAGGSLLGLLNSGSVTSLGSFPTGGALGEAAGAGAMVNCFSIGSGGGSAAAGGLIAKRDAKFTDEHSIIDSAYLPGETPSGTVSVANESDPTNMLDKTLLLGKGDMPTAPQTGNFYYRMLTEQNLGADLGDKSAIYNAVIAKISNYTYSITPPTRATAESVAGYDYSVTWDAVQGPVGGYEVLAKDASGKIVARASTDSRIITTAILHFGAENVGGSFDVYIKSLGVKIGHDASADSGEAKLATIKVLEPLPKPNFGGDVQVKDTRTYIFTIESAPYDKIRASIANFTGGDKALPTADLGIKADSPPYSFTYVYSEEQLQSSHIMQAQARSSNPALYAHSEIAELPFTLRSALPAPQGLALEYSGSAESAAYRLLWDEVANATGYQVSVYDGTKKYDSGPLVLQKTEGDAGYKIETVTESGVERRFVSWGYSLPESLLGKSLTFTVVALGDQTLGAASRYISSPESAPFAFVAAAKLAEPKITGHLLSAAPPAKMDFTWEELAGANGYSYEIWRSKQASGAAPELVAGKSGETQDTALELALAEEDFGFDYVLKLKAKGMLGTSLNSAETEYSAPVYPRLAKPTLKTAAPLSSTTGVINIEIEWADAAFLPKDCDGWRINIYKNTDAGDAVLVETKELALEKRIYNLEITDFTLYDAPQYSVEITAKGAAGQFSDSLPSEQISFLLPTMLKTPVRKDGAGGTILSFKKADGAEYAAGEAVLIEDYIAAKLSIGWENWTAAELTYLASFYAEPCWKEGVKVVPMTGAEQTHYERTVEKSAITAGADVNIEFSPRAEDAGKTLIYRISGKAASGGVDSTAMEVEVLLPEILLPAPEVLSLGASSAGGITVLTASWTPSDYTKAPTEYADGYALGAEIVCDLPGDLPGTTKELIIPVTISREMLADAATGAKPDGLMLKYEINISELLKEYNLNNKTAVTGAMVRGYNATISLSPKVGYTAEQSALATTIIPPKP